MQVQLPSLKRDLPLRGQAGFSTSERGLPEDRGHERTMYCTTRLLGHWSCFVCVALSIERFFLHFEWHGRATMYCLMT